MRNDVIVYIEEESRVNWQAKTSLDKEESILVISVPVENNETVFVKFKKYEDGSSILVLNLPDTPEKLCRQSKRYFSFLKVLFEWWYNKEMPDPITCNFGGQHFYDWKPNSFCPMRAYLFGKKLWNKTRINNFILGNYNEKETEV